MLPPIFTPAQSRLLASVIATCFLVSTWSSFSSSILVNAVEIPTAPEIDAISQPVLHAAPDAPTQYGDNDGDNNGDNNGSGGYAPDFDYFDRNLLGRQEPQEPQINELKNNEKKNMEVNPGVTTYFVLKKGQSRVIRADADALEAQEARGAGNASVDTADGDADNENGGNVLRKRQAGNRVWVSANTCHQPIANGAETPENQPQLVMYVSTSSQNQKPGPDSTQNLVTPPSGVLFDNGFASFELNATSDVYIGISAPNLEKDWNGSWSFEVAASVDGPYHSFNNTHPFLYMIDTDSQSALFITYNLNEPNTTDVDKWRDNNPFRMYAFPVGDQTNITGMEHSLCALKDLSPESKLNVSMGITTKFGGGLPKSQFHIQGLKNGTKYNGFLTVEGGKDVIQLPGATAVRGGGMVFQQFEWITKATDSCQVLFDLKFCDSVAYAVPSSPDFKLEDDRLKTLYDNQAEAYYTNFTRSLAQVACNTTSEAQYSLARTCKHCEEDYKNWLCSVLIPRCEDWSAPDDWLQERNVNALLPDGSLTYGGNVSAEFNQTTRNRFAYSKSRNPLIDDVIKPGPYKEMLPCQDLCFDIVRSCPAQLGFACPNSPARELSYGKRDREEQELKCNFPGAVVKLNVQGAASGLGARVGSAVIAAMLVVLMLGV